MTKTDIYEVFKTFASERSDGYGFYMSHENAMLLGAEIARIEREECATLIDKGGLNGRKAAETLRFKDV